MSPDIAKNTLPEWEPGVNGVLVETSVLLPDGSDYTFVRLDSSKSSLIAGEHYLHLTQNSSTPTVISSDDHEQIDKLGHYLSAPERDVVIKWGKTTFFEVPLDPRESVKGLLPHLNWQAYQEDYNIQWITHHSDEETLDITKSLMLGSFGDGSEDKIAKNFDSAVRNIKNRIYLVSKKDGLATGAFCINYIPELEEIILNSVAGVGHNNDPRIAPRGGKMPILMSALIEVINTEYPPYHDFGIGGKGRINYQGVKKLTFSSSGATKLYKYWGIPVSNASGLLISAKQ